MLRTLLACALVFALGSAHALTIEQARAIAADDSTESRIAALNAAVATSPDERTAAFIEALSEDAVKLAGTQVIVMDGDQGKDPVTGAPVTLPADAEDVVNNNLMRSALDAARAALQLASPDEAVRLRAAR